ncbi:MAG: diguanylate cyclase [Sulfurospirillum sp.]
MKKNRSKYHLLKEATILVVEDNESELEELGELFDIYFKKCYRAKDGKEGLEEFVQNHPDIVLSDLGMPVMDGFDMAKEIRKINKKTPVLLHTIYADNSVFLKAIECKISGYMTKPTNATMLLDTLLREYESIQKDGELKKEKMLKQAILDEFPDPMMVLDLERNILFANNVVKKGRYWKDTFPIKCYQALYGYETPCYLLGYKCDSDSAIKSGKNMVSFCENISKDGIQMCSSIKTVPIKDANGDIYALLKVIQDKTVEINKERELKQLASYDALTKLPNRTLLLDRLEQAILRSNRGGLKFALLFIDLDEFKSINDIYGHIAGDELLKEVSRRMKSSIRKVDTLARFGGDEFIIIIEEITDLHNVLFVTEDILSKLRVEFELNNNIKVNISCSIGIDTYSPKKDAKTENILLQNADIAMYEVKKTGKNGYKFFENHLFDHLEVNSG